MPYDTFAARADARLADDPTETRPAAVVSLDEARMQARPYHAAAISVEVAHGERLAEIDFDWRALIARADVPNVFMNPLLVKLAAESYPNARCFALLAWQEGHTGRNLVGVWAFAIGRAPQSILPIDVLMAPPTRNAYLATPVIDRSALRATLEAMLSCIDADKSLPKTVALDAMSMDSATSEALGQVLAARGTASCVLTRGARPMLASELDSKQYWEKALSGSSRKKLRQHRRRLAEKGDLAYQVLTEPADVEQSFERFLALEASGWKGQQGTALLNGTADTAYAKAMIGALASRGQASIHMLTLGGKPVSMQVVLRAGATAFTWKTAYDETCSDSSPGMLLLEDYTAHFLSDDSIVRVDSCAYDETGFMASWTERQAIGTLWFDATPGGSFAFAVLTRLQSAYLRARGAAKTAYLAYRKKRKR